MREKGARARSRFPPCPGRCGMQCVAGGADALGERRSEGVRAGHEVSVLRRRGREQRGEGAGSAGRRRCEGGRLTAGGWPTHRAQHVQRALAHPRHDSHGGGDVGRVRDLDPDVGERGAWRGQRVAPSGGAGGGAAGRRGAAFVPRGPMLNGTTYMVRPCMEPSKSEPSFCAARARREGVRGLHVRTVERPHDGAASRAAPRASGRDRASCWWAQHCPRSR